MNLINMNLL